MPSGRKRWGLPLTPGSGAVRRRVLAHHRPARARPSSRAVPQPVDVDRLAPPGHVEDHRPQRDAPALAEEGHPQGPVELLGDGQALLLGRLHRLQGGQASSPASARARPATPPSPPPARSRPPPAPRPRGSAWAWAGSWPPRGRRPGGRTAPRPPGRAPAGPRCSRCTATCAHGQADVGPHHDGAGGDLGGNVAVDHGPVLPHGRSGPGASANFSPISHMSNRTTRATPTT